MCWDSEASVSLSLKNSYSWYRKEGTSTIGVFFMPVYLEISPRRSGKSQRLLERAFYTACGGAKLVVVAAISKSSHDGLRNQFFATYGERMTSKERACVRFTSFTQAKSLAEGWDRNRPMPRFFFDEFDYGLDVPFIEGSYYATTPRRLRKPEEITTPITNPSKDLLVYAIQQNGGSFHRVLHTKPVNFTPLSPVTETHGEFIDHP
jgi:hypothetical protein